MQKVLSKLILVFKICANTTAMSIQIIAENTAELLFQTCSSPIFTKTRKR